MTPKHGSAGLLPGLAVLSGVAAYLALLAASYLAAGGALEYPLDDPYIHLAMAEQMRAGGYGVNPGEYAAAASSPLFPVLLMPLAGTAAQATLPMIWNMIGLVLAAGLWGRILWQAGFGENPVGLALAIAGPLALHMYGVAYIGMEHALHVAASLAIVSGLLRFLDEDKVDWILILGVLVSPLLRFEGLALAILAAVIVLARGTRGKGALLLALAVVPVMGFAFGLTRLGLDPLPSSVSAKMVLPSSPSGGLTAYITGKLTNSLSDTRAHVLVGFLAVALVLLFAPAVKTSGRRMLVLAVAGAGLAHLLLGRFGWMDRYEIYILCTMAAGLFAASAVEGGKRLVLLPLLPMLYAATIYLPVAIKYYPGAGNAVHVQQAQMGRFAKEHLKEPVAVNDLGHVAWANPNYVLDLWGLANHEARRLRLQDPHPGWADELTDARDVKFAMLYANWFSTELGDDWVLLGQLKTNAPAVYLGGTVVNFYLTRAIDTAPYVEKVKAWIPGLPTGASFEFAEGIAG